VKSIKRIFKEVVWEHGVSLTYYNCPAAIPCC